jgi:phosphoglycolate phosphatase-like HAD superfamily hydrolase
MTTAAGRALIFDVDGTLVDSNDAHAAAWSDALREVGILRDAAVIRPFIGKGGDKLLPEVAGISAEGERGSRASERRSEIFRDVYLPRIRPFPGVRALFERLKRDGARLAIASSAKAEELELLLKVAEVADLVPHRTSADQVRASKPDPDAVEAALAQLGEEAPIRRGDALMVGDTPYDIAAAERAGLCAVAVRCGGWSDADLAGARTIFDGPADLLRRYETDPCALPWARGC